MIRVIDKPCGYGKTQGAIKTMKNYLNDGRRFIYITPFLSEVDRVFQALEPHQTTIGEVVTPSVILTDKGVVGKTKALVQAVNEGKNLITTHSLFFNLQNVDLSVFEDYHLIMDEVVNTYDVDRIAAKEFKMLQNENLITQDEKGFWTWAGDENEYPSLEGYFNFFKNSKVEAFDDIYLVKSLPPTLFTSFKSIEVLTFLFEGTLLYAYLQQNNLRYSKVGVPKLEMQEYIYTIKDLITIENCYSKAFLANRRPTRSIVKDAILSSNHFDQLSPTQLRKIEDASANYKRKKKIRSGDVLFTTFKNALVKGKWAGLRKQHTAINARASNDHRDKAHLFYMANRFLPPAIKRYLAKNKVKFDEQRWAQSELIQWIFRSRIRNGEPITIFMPSPRMRYLLDEWLVPPAFDYASIRRGGLTEDDLPF